VSGHPIIAVWQERSIDMDKSKDLTQLVRLLNAVTTTNNTFELGLANGTKTFVACYRSIRSQMQQIKEPKTAFAILVQEVEIQERIINEAREFIAGWEVLEGDEQKEKEEENA